MAPTEELEIIELEERHLAGALALSQEAHWNQIEADWRMMLKAGTVFGFEVDGRLISTALTLPFGDHFGWVSMVLVTKDWQKKGLATRLLHACIDSLEAQGLVPILDATAEGQNVYRPLGFVPHYGLKRWQHEAAEKINVVATTSAAPEKVTIPKIDREVFGGDRPAVLESLIERSRYFACADPTANGILLGRDGRVATQFGPIYTYHSESALTMLDHALSRVRGKIYIDVFDHQPALEQKLEGYGFTVQRPFLRMAKNDGEVFGEVDRMFAMAGPELG